MGDAALIGACRGRLRKKFGIRTRSAGGCEKRSVSGRARAGRGKVQEVRAPILRGFAEAPRRSRPHPPRLRGTCGKFAPPTPRGFFERTGRSRPAYPPAPRKLRDVRDERTPIPLESSGTFAKSASLCLSEAPARSRRAPTHAPPKLRDVRGVRLPMPLGTSETFATSARPCPRIVRSVQGVVESLEPIVEGHKHGLRDGLLPTRHAELRAVIDSAVVEELVGRAMANDARGAAHESGVAVGRPTTR